MSGNSPAPGVPQSPHKAVVASVASAVVGFVMWWVADTDPFTAKEAAEGAVMALVGSGLVVGIPTWSVKNKRK